MANYPIGFHEWIGLYFSIVDISIFKMIDFQEILVYIALFVALIILIKTFFGKKKSKKDCSNDNCGCN